MNVILNPAEVFMPSWIDKLGWFLVFIGIIGAIISLFKIIRSLK